MSFSSRELCRQSGYGNQCDFVTGHEVPEMSKGKEKITELVINILGESEAIAICSGDVTLVPV